MKLRSALLPLLFWPLLAWAQADTVLILNHWGTVDYADRWCAQAKRWLEKNSERVAKRGCDKVEACADMTAVAAACKPDSAQDLQRFESELAAQFTALAQCRAVRVLRYEGPFKKDQAANAAALKPHHDLSFEYRPGGKVQTWKLIGPDYRLTQGYDPAAKIVAQVCAVLAGSGRPASR